jgi:acetyl-CoA synthetase
MISRYAETEFTSYEDFKKRFTISVPENYNFAYDVVARIAAEDPARMALVWADDNGGERTITFGELDELTNRTANFFASLGIKRGDPVMLIMKGRYEFWYVFLALHKLGAIAIPATHLLTRKDLVYRNNAADIRMIVAVNDANVIANVDACIADSPTLQRRVIVGTEAAGWEQFEKGIAAASPVFAKPDDFACGTDRMLLYFTSGTTGHPKMVSHNFNYPLGHILTARFWQNVVRGGLHYTVADTGWAKSVWGKIYGQWIAGAVVFVYDYEKFVPKNLLGMLEKYKVATFCAPPTIYRYLIKEDLTQYDLSSLCYCAIAGEPLNPEVYQQFLKATGLKLMEGYGQTECTVAIATYPWLEPRPGSMGKPSPGYDIDLVDDDGRPVEAGEIGEIVIRTDSQIPVGMFDGYYRDEERTGSVWRDGMYHTGDTAWRDEDGYYWFVGRTDDVIKSSGYRIGPFEVESALVEHPAVLECAVTAVPDELRGAVVKATIVLAKGYAPSDALATELQEHVKTVTAPYKYPRIVEFVTELPKTISGKIRRVEIREGDGK